MILIIWPILRIDKPRNNQELLITPTFKVIIYSLKPVSLQPLEMEVTTTLPWKARSIIMKFGKLTRDLRVSWNLIQSLIIILAIIIKLLLDLLAQALHREPISTIWTCSQTQKVQLRQLEPMFNRSVWDLSHHKMLILTPSTFEAKKWQILTTQSSRCKILPLHKVSFRSRLMLKDIPSAVMLALMAPVTAGDSNYRRLKTFRPLRESKIHTELTLFPKLTWTRIWTTQAKWIEQTITRAPLHITIWMQTKKNLFRILLTRRNPSIWLPN